MSPSRPRAARYAKRRAKRVAASGSDLTDAQWRAIVAAWGMCAYCGAEGVPVQKDCVMPISRGGRYTLEPVYRLAPSIEKDRRQTAHLWVPVGASSYSYRYQVFSPCGGARGRSLASGDVVS